MAHHLLSVFCAFEAQVPENVIHKMQHLLVEKKNIRELCPILVLESSIHLEKIASQHAGHGQNKEWYYLHLDSCIQSSSTSASLVGCQIGIPKIEAR